MSNQIEVGSIATRNDKTNSDIYEVYRITPIKDFEQREQLWACIKSQRTGKRTSCNVKNLTLVCPEVLQS